MKIVQLSDTLAVSQQVHPEHMEQLAAAGFQVVINNRPDGEEAGQPSGSDIAAAAEAAGLEYHYLPVTAASFPGEGFEAMRRLLHDTSRPVLAFCRSGTRCTNLWVASQQGQAQEEAREHALKLGYDLSMFSRL